MSWANTGKEKPRYYLFAGMGGKASRRKHAIILAWSVVAGVVAAGALAFALYLLNRL